MLLVVVLLAVLVVLAVARASPAVVVVAVRQCHTPLAVDPTGHDRFLFLALGVTTLGAVVMVLLLAVVVVVVVVVTVRFVAVMLLLATLLLEGVVDGERIERTDLLFFRLLATGTPSGLTSSATPAPFPPGASTNSAPLTKRIDHRLETR
jgi:hypothetical protein